MSTINAVPLRVQNLKHDFLRDHEAARRQEELSQGKGEGSVWALTGIPQTNSIDLDMLSQTNKRSLDNTLKIKQLKK